jgi:UDP-N-acetylglucosamine 2-epimerase (non-hydrolysing)
MSGRVTRMAIRGNVAVLRTGNPRVAVVVGTRPEIVKVAAIVRLLGEQAWLLHTRQHQDQELAGVFFAAARLPEPQTLAGICGEPRHRQVGRMVEQLGDLFCASRPAAVIVQGDTNSASAGAQAASYAGVPVIHVEAGLRSFDRAMPEEINRCIVGVVADLHCAPTPAAVEHLLAEAIPASRIRLTGNTIVETTMETLPDGAAAERIAAEYGAEPGQFVLATIHRPENTDDPARLEAILTELGKLGLTVIMPIHPRTRLAAQRHGLTGALDRLRPCPPVDHRRFLALASLARLIVSDSGGVQEECTVLKKPLVVVRNSTERPESIQAGFAHLTQPGPGIGEIGRRLLSEPGLAERLAAVPCPFGDGTASQQIAAAARSYLRAG